RLALDQPGVRESLHHPREHRLMRLEIDQPPRARHCRMIGWGLVELKAEKAANAQGVCRTPGNGALGVESFKEPEQQTTKVATGRQTRPPKLVGIESLTARLDVSVEVRRVQDLIQSRVERMRGAPRQVLCRYPHRRLLVAPSSSFAHCHRRQCSTRDRSCRSLIQTFTTGWQ